MKRKYFLLSIICLSVFISLSAYAPISDTNLVEDVLTQTNKFRRSKGLPALIIRKELNEIAQRHSSDMARGRVRFGHSGFDKRYSQARKKVRSLNRFAENVAYGATSGKHVVTMWKNSAGHRRNMLGHFKYIGIGTAKDRRGRIFYTQVFGG